MNLRSWRTFAKERRALALGGTALAAVALGLVALRLPTKGGTQAAVSKMVAMDLMERADAPPPAAAPGLTRGTVGPAALAPSKLIRKGTLTLEVARMDTFEGRMQQLAAREGYLSEWKGSLEEGGQRRVWLTWRVPAERFDAALAAFKGLGKVLKEQVSTEDVGRAYADLEVRRANKRAAAARIRELITTRAAKLSDVVEAEESLARVTEELEQMEAQKRVMDGEIAYATLQGEVMTPLPAAVKPGLWAPLKDAVVESRDALVRSLAALVSFVALLLPWMILPAFAFGIWRRRRRKDEAEPVSPVFLP